MKGFSVLEMLAYKQFAGHAKRKGWIESEEELADSITLDRVIEKERGYLSKKIRLSTFLSALSAPISAVAGLVTSSEYRETGQKFVAGEPAHTDPVLVGKVIVPMEQDATQDHYEPIYSIIVNNPLLLAASIIIPVAVTLGIYARENWLDYKDNFLDNDYKIREIAKQRTKN